MKKILFLFASSLLLWGCLDQIKLDIPADLQGQRLLIQGRLTKGETAQVNVDVLQIINVDRLNSPEGVNDAEVTLRHTSGQSVVLKRTADGAYKALLTAEHPEFPVVTGQTYQIEVRLADGQRYRSTFEPLMEVPKMDTLSFGYSFTESLNDIGNVVFDTLLDYQIKTPLRISEDEKARLRWDIFGTYRLTDDFGKTCYLFEQIQVDEVKVFNDQVLNFEQLDSFVITSTPWNYRYAEGYFARIVQESLSPGAFAYWDQTQKVITRSGNMFDPPPGKLVTNIRNIEDPDIEVLGYFYATEQDTLQMYIPPERVGSPKRHCPEIPPSSAQTLCDNCLFATGSTLQRPKFWIE
jgi:hypothetical protein